MNITKIDHIHMHVYVYVYVYVYVDDIEKAEHWYQEILGFTRDSSLYFWFEQGGPLVIRNDGASLSLFLKKSQHPGHTMAFAVQASALLELIPLLKSKNIAYTVSDHDVSMSLYFSDLSGNKIEITSWEYKQAKQILENAV
ncbi:MULTISPECIES: VOC family protein [unclassified Pantoea]|uniref:VOC family protein n=1 Tax=unclassified Pantoea TaxID=2630326 RepID=UPI001CD51A3A|nr:MULTISPECIES: VOC family protein [unclassified Pantoea]MCA1175242.1 VOC family protein [Pantoea sp. alder69]MCA1250204.1 VOC family protein [Pantoea sp. alder70]MCA1263841.1 VOC family protein [Pantoea sp. alder81]